MSKRKERKPSLKDEENFGTQTRIYTMRGWVVCDDQADLDEEIRIIDNFIEKGEYK